MPGSIAAHLRCVIWNNDAVVAVVMQNLQHPLYVDLTVIDPVTNVFSGDRTVISK